MNLKRTTLLISGLLLALMLAGCQQEPGECPDCPECPEVECPDCPEAACPACPDCPDCPAPMECPSAVEAPYEALWAGSGHADASAEAFIHWDADDPPEVPTSCAKCHSTDGYRDFLGVDGTEAGVVDNNAPIGSVVTCIACHNEGTVTKDSVVFPSGVEIAGLGPESRCMECHQGRAYAGTVDGKIEELGLVDDLDAPNEELGFTNIHYYAAAATQAGGTAMGGYQYEGKSYDSRLSHVADFNTCVQCHDSHTLELRIEECSTCHTGIGSADDLKDVRMYGSAVDYDGDGNTDEGVYYEIEGLRELLYQAIQAYAEDVAGTPVVYDSHAYPYFFIDTDGDGEASEEEANYGNQYNAWTGRLTKAAYNYQVSVKDPGAYAHGGKYIIQLLYDSIEDLDPDLLAGTHRTDPGHFAGSEEAFRHWDEDGAVSASCSKCHSPSGLPFLLEHGVEIEQPLSNGLDCATCHNDLTTFTRHEVAAVEFPSGASLDTANPDSNICLNCHQGRESTVSLNARIGDSDDDAVVEGLSFANVHYFAAGATRFGAEAQGAYQYEGQEYNGRFAHVESFSSCTQCHSTHRLEVRVESCGACHAGVDSEEDLASIRMDPTDFDGDGDATEGIASEVETLAEVLYGAIQKYAAGVAGTPIIYDSHSYPYFFGDTDGNGQVDPGEAIYPNRYATWTPRLLRAAYNYQYFQKDPGAFAHNSKYIIQILYDSLVDLGADTAGMVRP